MFPTIYLVSKFNSQTIKRTKYRPIKYRALDMSYFVAQVMSKFTVNFGMTFAKKWTYREPEICWNGNKSTFRQNICPSDQCIWKKKKIHTKYHYICIFNSKSSYILLNNIISISFSISNVP